MHKYILKIHINLLITELKNVETRNPSLILYYIYVLFYIIIIVIIVLILNCCCGFNHKVLSSILHSGGLYLYEVNPSKNVHLYLIYIAHELF